MRGELERSHGGRALVRNDERATALHHYRGLNYDHAGQPITVEDAARAAGTTTAALVRAFRANDPLGLTPVQYLRRTRLDAAHRELQAGDPTAGDTVGRIAARWGFSHRGRFAQYYRQVYGTTPSHTLDS